MAHHYILTYTTPEEPDERRMRAIKSIGDLVQKNEGTIVTLPEMAFPGLADKETYSKCALTTKKPITIDDYARLRDVFIMTGGDVKIDETHPLPQPHTRRPGPNSNLFYD